MRIDEVSYCFFDRFATKNMSATMAPSRIDSIGKPGIFVRPPAEEEREDSTLVICVTILCVCSA